MLKKVHNFEGGKIDEIMFGQVGEYKRGGQPFNSRMQGGQDFFCFAEDGLNSGLPSRGRHKQHIFPLSFGLRKSGHSIVVEVAQPTLEDKGKMSIFSHYFFTASCEVSTHSVGESSSLVFVQPTVRPSCGPPFGGREGGRVFHHMNQQVGFIPPKGGCADRRPLSSGSPAPYWPGLHRDLLK